MPPPSPTPSPETPNRSSVGNKAVGWADPAMQKCVHVVEAAGQKVPSPVDNLSGPEPAIRLGGHRLPKPCPLHRYRQPCRQDTDNARPLQRAGDTLGTVQIPALGSGAFSKAAPAGKFPLYLYTWNASARPARSKREAHRNDLGRDGGDNQTRRQ